MNNIGWDVFLFVDSAVLAAFRTFMVRRMWRDPLRMHEALELADFSQASFGPQARQGIVRAGAPTATMLISIAVIMFLVVVQDLASPRGWVHFWAHWLQPFFILCFAVSGICILLIVRFNTPKFMVPPHMRAEPGRLTSRRRSAD